MNYQYNNHLTRKIKWAIVASVICLGACNKEITERNMEYVALNPASQDEMAYTWKPIMLTSADQFGVAAPDSVKSTSYIAELNEVKSWQKEITDEEKKIISYWQAGAVLRWNEIMRELVAKYNIPPQENPDGSYPTPSANNPFAYPSFPFANPPYASRAYAYLSTAQYDALIAAWYYKSLYKRKAPYHQDNTIKALIPKNDMGSYPSEDAVVAGSSLAILSLLFPGEQDYLQQKMDEYRRYRILSGGNVRSDLVAGELLGKQVAQLFIARARTDRAGAAIGTPAQWAALKNNALNYGLIPWESMESPIRPPMLPFFGNVRPFLFDSITLATQLLPATPPLPGTVEFQTETNEVMKYSKQYDAKKIAIVHFWADGISTYTPPGHWNAIAADYFVNERYSEVRWARNMALLNMSLMDAAIACWYTKYHYFNARPSQINSEIKTWTGLPNFPAYTSGHSTFSGAAATILSHILPAHSGHFHSMAEEASLSRIYGAIHFRSDCSAGMDCGQRVASYAIKCAKADGAE